MKNYPYLCSVIKKQYDMAVKLNNSDNYESIEIRLSRDKFPIAFQNKVDELMESGAFDNINDAIKWVESTPIEVEMYYEKDKGLFLIEAEAVECGTIYSPYSGEECESID